VGIEGSKLVEIQGGLNAGDRVIVGGQDKYQEGEEVSPALEATQASETFQETRGMIDLKGEENASGEDGGHAAAGASPGVTGPRERGPGESAPRRSEPGENGSGGAKDDPGGAR
jgi:hypothetical protein